MVVFPGSSLAQRCGPALGDGRGRRARIRRSTPAPGGPDGRQMDLPGVCMVWPLARKGAPPLAIPGPRRQSSPPTGPIGALGSLAVPIYRTAMATGPFSSGQETAVHLAVFWPLPGQGPVGRLPVRRPQGQSGRGVPVGAGARTSSLAGAWVRGLVSCHSRAYRGRGGEVERGGREKGVQHSGRSTGMFA